MSIDKAPSAVGIGHPRSLRRGNPHLKPPKSRIGRVQRQIERAFIISDGKPLSTNKLMEWAYPRLRKPYHWCYRQLWQAAERFAVRIGRSKTGKGRPWLWAQRNMNCDIARKPK
jgi:hypothetical protein